MSDEYEHLSQRIDEIGAAVTRLGEALTNTNQRIGDISEVVVRLKALMEAHLERTRDERAVLFRMVDEHRERIAAIERDYVTEDALKEHKVEQAKVVESLRGDLHASNASIQELKQQMAKVMAWAAIGAAVLSVAGNAVLRLIW